MYGIIFRDSQTGFLQGATVIYFVYKDDFEGEYGFYLLSINGDEIFVKNIDVLKTERLIWDLHDDNKLNLIDYDVTIYRNKKGEHEKFTYPVLF